MLTVIIPTHDDEEKLARMLPGLVPHAVSGAISEAVVYDSGSSDATQRVAEIAGCRFVGAGATAPADLIAEARGQWLLFLDAGARPVGDWIDAVEEHVNRPDAGAARFRSAPDPDANWWRRLVGRRAPSRPFARGLLISKRQALALSRPDMALDALPRGLAARNLPAGLVPSRS